MLVIVEENLLLIWSGHKDDLISQRLQHGSYFSYYTVRTVSSWRYLTYIKHNTVVTSPCFTLMALAEFGSPSSTSSSSTPPRPSWSCLSSSLSKAFLSFKLYLGLKPYVASRTSIFGLLTSAWYSTCEKVKNQTEEVMTTVCVLLQKRQHTSVMSHCFCLMPMSRSLVSSRISSMVRKCVSPFWCLV